MGQGQESLDADDQVGRCFTAPPCCARSSGRNLVRAVGRTTRDTLRHACGRRGGEAPGTVQAWIGHECIPTTNRFRHFLVVSHAERNVDIDGLLDLRHGPLPLTCSNGEAARGSRGVSPRRYPGVTDANGDALRLVLYAALAFQSRESELPGQGSRAICVEHPDSATQTRPPMRVISAAVAGTRVGRTLREENLER
jgi:hypothetical protein